MSLVTTKDLMLDAQKNHYAIGAFNAENMEMVQAIIAAAEELRAPVIVQTTPGTLKYASPAMFHAMVAAAASEASVPVVMHLDHGSSYELAMQAFRAGYTSVMIDGSHHVFEEKIEVIAGTNLPMIVTAVTMLDMEDDPRSLADELIETGKDCIALFELEAATAETESEESDGI